MTWPTAYVCAPDLTSQSGPYSLRPISWEDREPIRQWRNAQIDVLRQDRPLTQEDQDHYFLTVIEPQMRSPRPEQVLVSLLHEGEIIGYGGPVHIAWPHRRGELSYLTAPERRLHPTFRQADWDAFMGMLVPLCRDQLRLHRLTTESFESRADIVDLLLSAGFENEGTLREHHWWDGRWHTSRLHGLLIDRG